MVEDTDGKCDLGPCTGCPLGCTGAGNADTWDGGNATSAGTCTGTANPYCSGIPNNHFATCNREACNDHGDAVNCDDAALAKCSCDPNWGGLKCGSGVSTVSIAGREFGACPVSECDPSDITAPATECPSCQEVLDELLTVCIEGEVEWFHDMEDDVRLPARAKEIGCILKGSSGEREEGETIFEDMGKLPEFLEAFLITAYVCYALALLCEDFFVASLDIIVAKLALPPDVAGATFMAAGSSAPELFVSAAGVFITHSPVGVGACAGSTMFNTMCIIGGSALIAGKPVSLQWRSIVRDCGVYIVSLVVLLILLQDGLIEDWESIIMLALYVTYIILCAIWNKIVAAVCPVPEDKVHASNDEHTAAELLTNAATERNESIRLAKRAASAKFRGSATSIIAIQRLAAHTELAKSTTNLLKQGDAESRTTVSAKHRKSARAATMSAVPEGFTVEEHQEEGHHEHPGLCDIPATSGARLAWAISFPLMFIFTFTVPNCAKHEKMFPVTFVMCIVWLGILVEVMVEHASEFGALLGFSPGILGLTLLAAGTSFPDLVASLIVAKQGSIDMAVSNAFGSNNFDVLLCLGLPWFLSTAVVFGRAEIIDTNGIMTALISLIITTALWFAYMSMNKWVLTPGIGFTMLTTYATWLICQLIVSTRHNRQHGLISTEVFLTDYCFCVYRWICSHLKRTSKG